MTHDQIVKLFGSLKSRLPKNTRQSRAIVCAFLRYRGYASNVWVPIDNPDSRLAHIEVTAAKHNDRIAISIGDKSAGKRSIAKLTQLPNEVIKVILLRNPDYGVHVIDNGIIVIGL